MEMEDKFSQFFATSPAFSRCNSMAEEWKGWIYALLLWACVVFACSTTEQPLSGARPFDDVIRLYSLIHVCLTSSFDKHIAVWSADAFAYIALRTLTQGVCEVFTLSLCHIITSWVHDSETKLHSMRFKWSSCAILLMWICNYVKWTAAERFLLIDVVDFFRLARGGCLPAVSAAPTTTCSLRSHHLSFWLRFIHSKWSSTTRANWPLS